MTLQTIVSNPKVMMGKPVVSGARITDDLLKSHPRLTRAGLQAALIFAREALRADVVYPIAETVQ